MKSGASTISELQISTIKEFFKITGTITLNETYQRIKAGYYQKEINYIRQLFDCGRDEEGDDIKKTLPAFTASGVFANSRKEENLVKYSQLVMLDLDNLSRETIEIIKSKAIAIVHTVLCFISPSGLGLKIAVIVNTNKEHHKEAYRQVSEYYTGELSEHFDLQTKDIARQCYFSSDKEAYYNENAKIFKVDLQKITLPNSEAVDNDRVDDPDFDLKYENVVSFTENKKEFVKGNRNNFIYLLGCNCNRFGLNINKVITSSINRFANSFNIDEIKSTIQSAYKNNILLFATEADKPPHKQIDKEGNIDQSLDDHSFTNTPTISQFVVDNLPDFIRILATSRESDRERDVIITTMLVLLSGCLYKTSGSYDGSIVYPSLLSFIVAPPGSGKGVMRLGKDAFQFLSKKLEEESRQDLAEYYNTLKLVKEGDVAPSKPPYNQLFIPGNSSAAAIYEHLNNCSGRGIICESEADALGNILKNDWGNFSDILRAAFHHECVSINRKGGKIIIDLPRLSAILTGTPSQVPTIIKSVEDGLFSRFIYYCFCGNSKWRNVAPKSNNSELLLIRKLIRGNIYTIVSSINLKPLSVDLASQQWVELNRHFDKKLKELTSIYSNDVEATVYRMGLIAYRIAMILTALRNYQEDLWEEKLMCSDLHFKMAIQLTDVYLEHGMAMFKSLPKSKYHNASNPNMMQIFESLPNDAFKRIDFIRIAKGIGIIVHPKTYDNYLDRLVKLGLLTKDNYNQYCKVVKSK